MVIDKDSNKIPVSVTVNLTKTEIKTIRDAIHLKGRNSNETIIRALISTAKTKKLRLWN